MATELKTYEKRPECAVPDCKNEAYIYVAGRWICGNCCITWAQAQREKEKQINDAIFDDIVNSNKNEEKD